MTHLFYLTTILFLFYELKWIYSPVEETKTSERFMKLGKENKGKKWDEMSIEYKEILKNKIPVIFILIWMFVGLFTHQWFAFLIILAFNMTVGNVITRLTRFSMFYTVFHWLNSVIGFGFGVFIILNHYHFHIDLYQSFLKLVQPTL